MTTEPVVSTTQQAPQEPVTQQSNEPVLPVGATEPSAPEQTGQPAAVQAPVTQPQPTFEEITGGVFKSREEVAALREQTKVLTDPLAQKILDSYANGGISRVADFVRIQNIDTGSMSQVDLIKLSIGMKNPEFDSEMIEYEMTQQGYSFEDPTSVASKRALVLMAKAAKEHIEGEKVTSQQPLADLAEARRAEADRRDQVNNEVTDVVSKSQKTPILVEVAELGTYTYPVSDEQEAQVNRAAIAHFTGLGVVPTSEELTNFKQTAIQALHGKEIMKKMMDTMYKSGYEAGIRKNAGPTPTGVPEGEKQTVQPTQRKVSLIA